MRTDRLVLVVPGLLLLATPPASPSHTNTSGIAPALDAPCLARLLASASAPALEADGIDAALARVYELQRQNDWPLAAVLVDSLGIEPGEDYWLLASPITLVVGRNEVRLAGAVTDLVPDDAVALLATLNAHFAADGLVFIAPRPDRWFVRAATVPALVTHSLVAAINQPLRELLPSGPDAGKWRRWQDEMQMLLHEHPVNAAREQRGELPVNSIWLWGGGTRPPARRTSIGTWANDETAAALARHVGAPASALPADLDAVIASGGSAETMVVVLDRSPELGVLERAWIAPAWAAMCRGMVATVTLIADGNGSATVWTARRPGVWQQLTSRVRSPDLRALLADARA